MARTFLAILIAVILGAPGTRAADLPAVGEVLALAGQCTAETNGQHHALAIGDQVHAGDVIEVAPDAKLKLRMEDGSIIAAGSGTRVTIATYDVAADGQQRDAVLQLTSGLLRAIVSKLDRPSHFEVDTATGVAAVRSTDWFVEAGPSATKVGVLEGAVTLASVATKRSLSIPARWGAVVEGGRDPVPSRLWTQAEFDDVIRRTALQ